MHDTFESIHSLFSTYLAVKLKQESAKCTTIPERFERVGESCNTQKAKSQKEDAFAFLGDVQIFFDERRGFLPWYESHFIRCKIGEILWNEKRMKAGNIIKSLHRESKKRIQAGQNGFFPRSYNHPQHHGDLKDKIIEKAEGYFSVKGYLV